MGAAIQKCMRPEGGVKNARQQTVQKNKPTKSYLALKEADGDRKDSVRGDGAKITRLYKIIHL